MSQLYVGAATFTHLSDSNLVGLLLFWVGGLWLARSARQRLSHRAAERLRRSEERYRSLLAVSAQFVWRTEPDGRVTEEIPSWCAYTGQTAKQAVGWGWLDALHPDDRAAARRRWEAAVETRSPYYNEYRIRRHDGEYRYCEGRAVPILDSDGSVREWVGACCDITERKCAEEAIIFNNTLLRTQQEVSPDGILVVDDGGRLISFNQRFVEMWGLTAEVIATGSDELALKAVLAKVVAADAFLRKIAEVYESRDHCSYDEIALCDGRTFERHSAPMVSPSGSYLGRVWYFRDITLRKISEQQARSLLTVAQAITGTLNHRELLDRVQRETATVLGCDAVVTFGRDPDDESYSITAHHGLSDDIRDSVLGLQLSTDNAWGQRLLRGEVLVINGPEDASAEGRKLLDRFGIGCLIAAPLAVRGQRYGILMAIRTADRPRFQPHDIEVCIGIAQQLGVAIASAELYRTQKEEAALSSTLARVGQELISSLGSSHLLDRLCQVTAEAIGCDASFTILWEPREQDYAIAATHGFPDDSPEGLTALRLPANSLAGLLPHLAAEGVVEVQMSNAPTRWAALPAQYGLKVCAYVPLRRGEEIIGVLAAGFRSHDKPAGRNRNRVLQGLAHLASLALDNARLFTDLERADRLKSDFVATMSHELRTPMNIIMGYNELLLDGVFGSLTDEQQDTLRSMDRNARQLLELINATLDVGRLEAGRSPLQLTEIQMADLIGQVRDETQHLHGNRDIHFEWQIGRDLPPIRSDAGKLKIVLKNLLSNAAKFTDQGTIGVATELVDGGIGIRVWDTGIGIPREKWPVVFEPFLQLQNSVGRSEGGVGLGLYLVRRLLDLLGGTISVESEVGRGTQFQIVLPIDSEALPAMQVAA